MIFKRNVADNMKKEVAELLENFRNNINPDLKENNSGGYISQHFENRARSAKIKKDNAATNMKTGYAFAGAGILTAAMGSAVLATTSIVGGALLLGATSGVVVPALAFVGINKLLKNHHESVENKNSMRVVNDSAVVRNKFDRDLNKALSGLNDKDYKEIVDQVSIADLKNSDIHSFNAKAEKFMSLVNEKTDKGSLFKNKVSDELENKILKLMDEHKKELDFDGKALTARNKADKANKFMLGSLFTAGAGAVAGVGGLAASLQLGVGTAAILGTGMTVGGAILAGGVFGVAAPALAFMGISKMVKSYHESVAEKNESLFNYRKAEFAVADSFLNKLSKVLGKGSDMDNMTYKTGIARELSKGYSIDENTQKLLEMVKESKNKVESNSKNGIKNTI